LLKAGEDLMSVLKQAKRRVLLVDDHPMIRQGLAGLINEDPDLMVCGEAGDSRQGLELIASVKPNLAIVDISLDERDGIELIKEVRAQYPQVLMLVLSMHDEGVYAERALRAGASGYVMKAEAAGTVMSAIHRVLSGKIYISEKVNDQLVNRVSALHKGARTPASPIEEFSDRELQIFRLLGDGVRVRDIAAQLYISIKTVESHRANIKKKLDLQTSAELLRYAIQYLHTKR
jgi:DNA-binding NarL/FixJ family response regulator